MNGSERNAVGTAHTRGRALPWTTFKRAGAVLIPIGVLWLSVLLVPPVYTEPGSTGDINCAKPWRADPTDQMFEHACHRAIVNRRIVILLPAASNALGVGVVVLARRDRQLDSNGTLPGAPPGASGDNNGHSGVAGAVA
jgi:hypothetical protein